MSATVTSQRTVRRPRKALHVQKIALRKVALKRHGLKKHVHKRHIPNKDIPKRRAPKKHVRRMIAALSVIVPTTPKFLTSITTTLGSATIPAATMPGIIRIILGNTVVSQAALAVDTSTALVEEVAIASGSIIGTSA
jgi:hypothetical protein